MKKLKLRTWVKVTLSIIVLFNFLNIAINRIEQIENGNIKVINESQMAERN